MSPIIAVNATVHNGGDSRNLMTKLFNCVKLLHRNLLHEMVSNMMPDSLDISLFTTVLVPRNAFSLKFMPDSYARHLYSNIIPKGFFLLFFILDRKSGV